MIICSPVLQERMLRKIPCTHAHPLSFLSLHLCSYFTIYVCVFVAVTSWSIWGFDPALVSFEFESPPGIMLSWMRVGSAVWFSYACWTTIRKYPEKRRFYAVYYIICALWIMSMPLVTGVIAPQVAITHRKRVVFFVECFSLFAAHLFMGALWWPSNFVETFPFLPEVGAEKRHGQVVNQGSAEGSFMSSASRDRVALTGGDAHTQEIDPTRAAFEMVSQLRFQLMALQDHSDDLYEHVRDMHEENEEALINGRDISYGDDSDGGGVSSGSSSAQSERDPAGQARALRTTTSTADGNRSDESDRSPTDHSHDEIDSGSKRAPRGDFNLERPRTPQRMDLKPDVKTPPTGGSRGPPSAPPRSTRPSGKPPGSAARRMYAQAKLRSQAGGGGEGSSPGPRSRAMPDSPGGF